MKLRNVAMVFCTASALLAACGSDDDSGVSAGGSAGAGGKSTAGAAGKGGGAGAAGKGGSSEVESAGSGGEAGSVEAAGMGGEGGAAPIVDAFTVTLENIAPSKLFTSSGVFNTPVGNLTAGPATPGKT